MTPSGPAECPKEEYLTPPVLMNVCVLEHAVTQLQQEELKVLSKSSGFLWLRPVPWVWEQDGLCSVREQWVLNQECDGVNMYKIIVVSTAFGSQMTTCHPVVQRQLKLK